MFCIPNSFGKSEKNYGKYTYYISIQFANLHCMSWLKIVSGNIVFIPNGNFKSCCTVKF